jgi:hypothetical protein
MNNDASRALGAACLALLTSTAPAIAGPLNAANSTAFAAPPRATELVNLTRTSARVPNQGNGQGADRRCSPDRPGPLCGAAGDEKKEKNAVAVPDLGATLPLLGTAAAGLLMLRRRWRQ